MNAPTMFQDNFSYLLSEGSRVVSGFSPMIVILGGVAVAMLAVSFAISLVRGSSGGSTGNAASGSAQRVGGGKGSAGAGGSRAGKFSLKLPKRWKDREREGLTRVAADWAREQAAAQGGKLHPDFAAKGPSEADHAAGWGYTQYVTRNSTTKVGAKKKD